MPRSFADGSLPYHSLDLQYVNRELSWNPLPRNRQATQQHWWDDCETSSSSARQSRKKPHRERISLENARRYAEENAHLLVRHHLGRAILGDEAPGTDAVNPRFWLARAAYYKLEYDRIQEESSGHLSGSVTPEVINSDIFCRSEVGRAMCEAGNVARMLARYPGGKRFLEAESIGSSEGYRSHWWDSMKNWQGLNTEGHQGLSMDPEYWWGKKSVYSTRLDTEIERTSIERAKQSAASKAQELATFPAGQALLEAESHEHFREDAEYWMSRRNYYTVEYEKLEQDFWDRWRLKHLTTGDGPFQAPKRSAPKTKERRMARGKHTRDTGVTKSDPERGKGIHRSPNHGGTGGIASQRRQSKTKHRQQITSPRESKRLLLPTMPSVLSSRSTGYATPRSDAYDTRLSSVKKLPLDPQAQESQGITDEISEWEHKTPCLQGHNHYVTPSSPKIVSARARQCRLQQSRRQDKHITGIDSRASPPISSRLRSSKRAS